MSQTTDDAKTRSVTIGGVTFDVKFTLLIVLATLLPTVDHYHNVTRTVLSLSVFRSISAYVKPDYAYDQTLFFFLIPMAVILFVFRDRPQEYGFTLGKVREGLLWTSIVCPIICVILWFLVRNSDMESFYRQAFYNEGGVSGMTVIGSIAPQKITVSKHLHMLWISFLLIFPWEFLWRGFFLFGLARVIGPGPAILIQAIPFALLHIGKPEVETLTTIFGGTGFGFIAWRTKSFLYPVLIHYIILVVTILIASGTF